jgi:hypothetical protein
LDVAINSIHALGIQEIGPLSLQAIALREPDLKDLVRRITQLNDLGISVGESLYSRAVVKFSQNREYANLESLLNSDQHPDALENSQLQENLLSSYAENKDWGQYRRTLAVQKLRGKSPQIAKENLLLRVHARRRDAEALQGTLELMRQNGTPVSGTSIFAIVRCFCRQRRMSRRPTSMDIGDIHFTVSILKQLAYTGSHVPATVWREILCRLGMLGRLRELENLCSFLASWYTPMNNSTSVNRKVIQHRLLTQLSVSHPLHPLKIIFSTSFQKVLIEWGFIHALNVNPNNVTRGQHRTSQTALDVTFGLRLLQKLFAKGVHIDMRAVRKAIMHRLVVYYGPGLSSRKYNQRARLNLRLRYGKPEESYEQIISQIDDALGANVFAKLSVPHLAALRSNKMSKRVQSRQQRIAARAARG